MTSPPAGSCAHLSTRVAHPAALVDRLFPHVSAYFDSSAVIAHVGPSSCSLTRAELAIVDEAAGCTCLSERRDGRARAYVTCFILPGSPAPGLGHRSLLHIPVPVPPLHCTCPLCRLAFDVLLSLCAGCGSERRRGRGRRIINRPTPKQEAHDWYTASRDQWTLAAPSSLLGVCRPVVPLSLPPDPPLPLPRCPPLSVPTTSEPPLYTPSVTLCYIGASVPAPVHRP